MYKTRTKIFLGLLITISLFLTRTVSGAQGQTKWSGVDETIVEKVAQEHGRTAWKPFINTDQGDLLLFVFLLAGAGGGFLLGYFWRKLFVEKADLRDAKRNI